MNEKGSIQSNEKVFNAHVALQWYISMQPEQVRLKKNSIKAIAALYEPAFYWRPPNKPKKL